MEASLPESLRGTGPEPPGSDPASPPPATGLPDGAALLRELDRMRVLLAGRAANKGGMSLGQGERLLVVGCFAPGLSLEKWHALLRGEVSLPAQPAKAALSEESASEGAAFSALPSTLDPTSWFAFDLDPAQHPQLVGLCREGAHLFGLVCPLTGALLPQAFQRQLGVELTHVRTGGGELTLVLFELTGTLPAPRGNRETASAPPEASFPSSPLDSALCGFSRIVRANVRACDIPGRLAADRLAVLMPGVGPFRARALAERLLASFHEEASILSPGDEVQIRAGIACFGGEMPLSADALLRQAGNALALAQPGFTRTFRKAGAPEPERKTQVQACEKAFLFFGDTE